MGDSAMAVVAIIVATIIMGIFPLMAMANQTDKTTNLTVQTATTELVNKVRATGKLSGNDYDNFISELSATGNSYDASITVQIADGNLAKKEGNSSDKIYYNKYNTQVMEEIYGDNGLSRTMNLKEGDVISVTVKNTNTTIAQQLRNFMYKVIGNSSSAITAEASGMVTTSGN